MAKEVKEFIRTCKTCQKYKSFNVTPAGEMHSFTPKMKPGLAYSVDIIGPLPRTKRGNVYILVFVDICTKFLIAAPMRSATGKKVANLLVEKVILEYGNPELILCDNGVQFISKEFKETCTQKFIKIHYTPFYFPQANVVERYNKNLKVALAMFAGGNHRLWDEHLPYIVFALRTAVSEVTGFTPAYLTFGRELSNPFEILRETEVEPMQEFDAGEYAEELEGKLPIVYETARKAIEKAKEQQARQYNLRRRNISYKVGDTVWRKNFPQSSKVDYIAAKLQPKFIGPFTIAKVFSQTQYELKSLTGKSAGRWHISHLKPVL